MSVPILSDYQSFSLQDDSNYYLISPNEYASDLKNKKAYKRTVSFEEIPPLKRQRLIEEDEDAKIIPKIISSKKYQERSLHSSFVALPPHPFPGKYPDIGMDKFMIIVPSGKEGLATSAVASCFAICLRGKTEKGESLIGFCHTSHIYNLELVLYSLTQEMIKKSCISNTIEIFILGGQLTILTDNTEEEFKLITEVLQEEMEALELTSIYNIVGLKFNITEEDEELHIVLTADKIYYSYNKFFSTILGYEEAGDELDDLCKLYLKDFPENFF